MKTIIEFLKSLFTTEAIQTNLEAYIVAGNPQTSDDVDRLERQFWDQRQRQSQFFLHR